MVGYVFRTNSHQTNSYQTNSYQHPPPTRRFDAYQTNSYQEPPSPRRILQFFFSFSVVLLRRSGVHPLAFRFLNLLAGTLHSANYLGQTVSSEKSGEPICFSFQASNAFPKTFWPGVGQNCHLSFICFVFFFCLCLCSSASNASASASAAASAKQLHSLFGSSEKAC